MPEKLDNYDFSGRGRPKVYPYEEWADGNVYRLTKGTDYTIQTKSMYTGILKWARKNGYLATVHQEGEDAVVFQMLKESAE